VAERAPLARNPVDPPAVSLAVEHERNEIVLDSVFRAEELRVHLPRRRHDHPDRVTVAGLGHKRRTLLAELRRLRDCPQEHRELVVPRHGSYVPSAGVGEHAHDVHRLSPDVPRGCVLIRTTTSIFFGAPGSLVGIISWRSHRVIGRKRGASWSRHREGMPMHARVAVYEIPGHRAEESIGAFRKAVAEISGKGVKEVYVLVSPESDRALTMTLWEKAQDMEATRLTASRLRSEAAKAVDGTVQSVVEYKVAIHEMTGT